jgi:hypothetical protein
MCECEWPSEKTSGRSAPTAMAATWGYSGPGHTCAVDSGATNTKQLEQLELLPSERYGFHQRNIL